MRSLIGYFAATGSLLLAIASCGGDDFRAAPGEGGSAGTDGQSGSTAAGGSAGSAVGGSGGRPSGGSGGSDSGSGGTTGGNGGTNTAGSSAGGDGGSTSAGGTGSGGTNQGGSSAGGDGGSMSAGGSAGDGAGGTGGSGATGGTNTGGTSAGGTNSGGMSAGGTNAGGSAGSSGGSGGSATKDCSALLEDYTALLELAVQCNPETTGECSSANTLPSPPCGCPTLVNIHSPYYGDAVAALATFTGQGCPWPATCVVCPAITPPISCAWDGTTYSCRSNGVDPI